MYKFLPFGIVSLPMFYNMLNNTPMFYNMLFNRHKPSLVIPQNYFFKLWKKRPSLLEQAFFTNVLDRKPGSGCNFWKRFFFVWSLHALLMGLTTRNHIFLKLIEQRKGLSISEKCDFPVAKPSVASTHVFSEVTFRFRLSIRKRKKSSWKTLATTTRYLKKVIFPRIWR